MAEIEIDNEIDRAAEQRAALIDGLRQLATFLESRPDVPLPVVSQLNAFVDKETLAQIARSGKWEKHYIHDWFALRRQFGPAVALDINVPRNEVCRKVVTGTVTVPAVPAQPERVVETIEWVCEESLLESKS